MRSIVFAAFCASPAACGMIRSCPQQGSEVVYLTYDDGPCFPHTWDLADALTAEGVNATFYALGYLWGRVNTTAEDPAKAADSRLQLMRLRRFLANGHVLAHHSTTHSDLANLEDPYKLSRQLNYTQRLLEAQVAEASSLASPNASLWRNRHFRPPYGSLPSYSLAAAWVSELFDLDTRWDIDTLDWNRKEVSDVDTVLQRIDRSWQSGTAGHIILMHECKNWNATGINASLRIVRHLKEKCPKCIFPSMDHCLDLLEPHPSAQPVLRRPIRPIPDTNHARVQAAIWVLVFGMALACFSTL